MRLTTIAQAVRIACWEIGKEWRAAQQQQGKL